MPIILETIIVLVGLVLVYSFVRFMMAQNAYCDAMESEDYSKVETTLFKYEDSLSQEQFYELYNKRMQLWHKLQEDKKR